MKLFVTDYDGTLFISEKKLKTSIKKLKKLQEKGFLITIATGRSYSSIKNQTSIYNIPYDYLICADGSVIYNNEGKLENIFSMQNDIVTPFQDFYQTLNYEEIQFTYPEYYSNILIPERNDLLGINICLSTENYTTNIVNEFIKMSEDFPNYNFLDYMHPNFSYLCVKPKGISKAASIHYLVNKYKIPKEDVFVIGDSSNDIEMINDYNGVCVSTSYQEVLDIAKKIYPSIDNYINDILKED